MFSKKREKKAQETDGWTDRAATKFSRVAIRVQLKFSRRMNQLFSTMSVKKIKVVLALFCLVSGGYSVYLAAHSITGVPKKSPAIKVDPVRLPQHFDQSESEHFMPRQSVTDEMYEEMQGYRRYMDSIGRPIRQSLLDSMAILEEIYHSQTIK